MGTQIPVVSPNPHVWKLASPIPNEEDMTLAVRDPARGSNISQRDRWLTNLELFQSVTRAYAELRNLPPLVACNCDPHPLTRSLAWTPASAEYAVDVEHAVKAAIANRPDTNELLTAWHNLVSDPEMIGEAEKRLIQRASRIFAIRGLRPSQYFVKVRKGRAMETPK